jgi:Ca2+-binding RTX toxin-like protein
MGSALTAFSDCVRPHTLQPNQEVTMATINGTTNDDVLLGTALPDVINGLDGNDTLSGLGGNDTLNGGEGNDRLDGGTGIDTMVGGNGDDTYIIDSPSDLVTEGLNGGRDTIESSISKTLGIEVEDLLLTGISAINGTGNTEDNLITGNAANNILDGGTGNDTLRGGGGNDTYVVDSLGDLVEEFLQRRHGSREVGRQLYARRLSREPDPDRQRKH